MVSVVATYVHIKGLIYVRNSARAWRSTREETEIYPTAT